MNDELDEVRNTFRSAEQVTSDAPVDFTTRKKGGDADPDGDDPDGPDLIETDGDLGLPGGFPVHPLGMAGGKFHFLTARGEMTELSAGAMNNRSNLVALVAGCQDPVGQLERVARPESKRDHGFNVSRAADQLMQACSALPLFDPSMPIRHFGTWRGRSEHPIVHLGESIQAPGDDTRTGRMIAKALYPAVPSRSAPGTEAAQVEDLKWIRDRIQRFWNWAGDSDADYLMGFVGQGVLGQFPSWRTHMYVKGKHGSGKTTATKVVSALLGGMSTGVKNSTSAAAIRQTTNRMAVTRIFDEAEADDSGSIAEVIALFRLMSDAEGAQVERGTSDHAGIRFELYGAGFLASIIPAQMTSADRSRFVILTLGEREVDDDPADQALLLDELQRDAEALGPAIWRRMLDLAPARWDQTFRVYNGLVQGLGARARTGDTIGAILAGWDLMLHDAPLVDPSTGKPDEDRLERAKALAQPLIAQSKEAEEEGEGERCLRTIFAALIHKDHGGVITAQELLERMQDRNGEVDQYDNRLIGRLGLRLLDGKAGDHDMFIANGQNPLLDRALAGTRWRGGGHRAALDTIRGVHPAPSAIRVAGRPVRGLIIPARLLPGGEETPLAQEGDSEKA